MDGCDGQKNGVNDRKDLHGAGYAASGRVWRDLMLGRIETVGDLFETP